MNAVTESVLQRMQNELGIAAAIASYAVITGV
jgi:hypothetical protein